MPLTEVLWDLMWVPLANFAKTRGVRQPCVAATQASPVAPQAELQTQLGRQRLPGPRHRVPGG